MAEHIVVQTRYELDFGKTGILTFDSARKFKKDRFSFKEKHQLWYTSYQSANVLKLIVMNTLFI